MNDKEDLLDSIKVILKLLTTGRLENDANDEDSMNDHSLSSRNRRKNAPNFLDEKFTDSEEDR